MHGKLFPSESLGADFPDNKKTNTTQDNQCTGHHIQQHIVPIWNQILEITQNIESGVIKSGDGME